MTTGYAATGPIVKPIKKQLKKAKRKFSFLSILSIIGKIIIGLALTYAVVFSIVGTVAAYKAYKAYKTLINPIKEVADLSHNNPKETAFMKKCREDLKKEGRSETLSQIFIPLDSISKNLKLAVIAAEDDGFYTHPGFDIAAILDAYQYNRAHNRIVRGASTITQQLAKNLFLSSERSFIRKFMELGYTLLLEKTLGKDRILELYLNYAQWGDTLFGCEAASQCYFKKSSARLTLAESMRMAGVLASPERLNPRNPKSIFLQKRVETIANNLYLKHIIDDSAYAALCGRTPPKDSLAADSLDFTKMKETARAAITAKYFSTKPSSPPLPSKKSRR
jgi:monofunctional glycosyltransferase